MLYSLLHSYSFKSSIGWLYFVKTLSMSNLLIQRLCWWLPLSGTLLILGPCWQRSCMPWTENMQELLFLCILLQESKNQVKKMAKNMHTMREFKFQVCILVPSMSIHYYFMLLFIVLMHLQIQTCSEHPRQMPAAEGTDLCDILSHHHAGNLLLNGTKWINAPTKLISLRGMVNLEH